MRELLLLVAILQFFNPAESVNGVIWDKKCEDFVPIFSVPAFAAAKQDVFMRSRKEETHNFQGRTVRFTYIEEWNIIQPKNNGTEVTGVIGEIWNTLSEYLNFTLKPVFSNETTLGLRDTDNNYRTGLLGVIQRNETDVIPRVEASNSNRLRAVQFTVPFWKFGHRLYIVQNVAHVPTWMLKLFSPRVWYAILIAYIIISLCNYLAQRINGKFLPKKPKTELQEYFFYNFGMICGQSYLPDNICASSRIVELLLGIFSLVIRTAFGALLIRYLTQTTFTIPFKNLKSLLEDTDFTILTLNGSLPQQTLAARRLQLLSIEHLPYEQVAKRYIVKNSREDMYRTVCTSEKYAIFQAQDIKRARGAYICPLNPVGKKIMDTWISSGIAKNFTYKRTIDIAIMRFRELGILRLLVRRWITLNDEVKTPPNNVGPIVIDQASLVLLMFASGLLLSFIIFSFEILIFYCKN